MLKVVEEVVARVTKVAAAACKEAWDGSWFV